MSHDFHPLRVAEIIRETADAVSIRLEPSANDTAKFAFRPGQHLTLRHGVGGEELRRNYSLCVSPSEGVLKIGVKKIVGGAFSTWANEALKVGDMIDAMAPHGSFTLTFDPRA